MFVVLYENYVSVESVIRGYLYLNVHDETAQSSPYSKRLSGPYTRIGPDRLCRFQEIEAPRFQDNRHMKVVRLSTLCAGCLYPLGNVPDTHF
jgi:hypothetical protein